MLASQPLPAYLEDSAFTTISQAYELLRIGHLDECCAVLRVAEARAWQAHADGLWWGYDLAEVYRAAQTRFCAWYAYGRW